MDFENVKITIVFNHLGYYKGKANIFANDYRCTRDIAKEFDYKLSKKGYIICNWCDDITYGDDIKNRILSKYPKADIKVFEVLF